MFIYSKLYSIILSDLKKAYGHFESQTVKHHNLTQQQFVKITVIRIDKLLPTIRQ